MLIRFAIPVTITALSEMAIYDVGTLIIGIFMLSSDVGYYNSADPIARIPLIISLSISTVLLPATAEAYTMKNQKLLQEYVVDCLRYCILTVLPLCVMISVFSEPVITILFGSNYIKGASVLSILVIGMSFYSIYMICSSILQGTGKPKLPMYILIAGTVLNIVLNVIFVNVSGIVGAGIGTTITTGILMIGILYTVIRNTKISLPWKNILLIVTCNIILMIACIIIPKTIIGAIIGFIVGTILYIVCLFLFRVLSERDIKFFTDYLNRETFLRPYTEKIIKFIEKHELIYKQ